MRRSIDVVIDLFVAIIFVIWYLSRIFVRVVRKLVWPFCILIIPTSACADPRYEELARKVVVVGSSNGMMGTGFILGRFVYTASHVVSGETLVKFYDGHVSPVTVLCRDEEHDLVKLHVENPPDFFPSVDLSIRTLSLDEEFVTIGHPSGLFYSFAQGRLMYPKLREVKFPDSTSHVYQFDITSYGGSSGSPVFDKDNNVVGVVEGMLGDTSITYVLPAEYLCKKLVKCDVKP